MNYRPWLAEHALRQMGGLPSEALDVLVQTMASICDNPYDRMLSMPVGGDSPAERMAELGDSGFIRVLYVSLTLEPRTTRSQAWRRTPPWRGAPSMIVNRSLAAAAPRASRFMSMVVS